MRANDSWHMGAGQTWYTRFYRTAITWLKLNQSDHSIPAGKTRAQGWLYSAQKHWTGTKHSSMRETDGRTNGRRDYAESSVRTELSETEMKRQTEVHTRPVLLYRTTKSECAAVAGVTRAGTYSNNAWRQRFPWQWTSSSRTVSSSCSNCTAVA